MNIYPIIKYSLKVLLIHELEGTLIDHLNIFTKKKDLLIYFYPEVFIKSLSFKFKTKFILISLTVESLKYLIKSISHL